MLTIVIVYLMFGLSIAMFGYTVILKNKVDKSINEEWLNYLEKPINENERMDYKRFYKQRNEELKASNKKQKSLYNVIATIFIFVFMLLAIRLSTLH